MMMGMGVGFGLVGLLMLVFWGGLILLVVLALRGLFTSGGAHPAAGPSVASNARQILDERYARGEIDREKYEEMRSDLRES